MDWIALYYREIHSKGIFMTLCFFFFGKTVTLRKMESKNIALILLPNYTKLWMEYLWTFSSFILNS